MRRSVTVDGRPSFVDKRVLIFVDINSTYCLDQVHSRAFISWVAALAVTASRQSAVVPAANLDQVSEVDLMLAAILGQDAAVDQSEEPGLC